jgi:hypothetical protein
MPDDYPTREDFRRWLETKPTAMEIDYRMAVTQREWAMESLARIAAEVERTTDLMEAAAERWFWEQRGTEPKDLGKLVTEELRRHNPEPGVCTCRQCADFRLLAVCLRQEAN